MVPVQRGGRQVGQGGEKRRSGSEILSSSFSFIPESLFDLLMSLILIFNLYFWPVVQVPGRPAMQREAGLMQRLVELKIRRSAAPLMAKLKEQCQIIPIFTASNQRERSSRAFGSPDIFHSSFRSDDSIFCDELPPFQSGRGFVSATFHQLSQKAAAASPATWQPIKLNVMKPGGEDGVPGFYLPDDSQNKRIRK